MEIVNLIAELLYTTNCVIVPGFGGFIANTKDATVTQDGRLTKPARKQLVFNQSLKENDGLLVNALSKLKSIDYETALHEVEFFVKFIGDRLDSYKNYELKNIGSFYLNAEGKLIFIPYDGANFLIKSYGLPNIKVKPLNPVLVNKPIVKEAEKPETKGNSESPAPIRWVNMAAAIVVIALAAGIAWKTLLLPIANQNQQAKSQIESSEPQTASVINDDVFEDTNNTTETVDYTEPIPTDAEDVDSLSSVEEFVNPEDSLENLPNEQVEPEKSVEKNREVTLDSLKSVLDEQKIGRMMYYIVVDKPESGHQHYLRKLERRAFTPYIMQGSKPGVEIICLEKFTNLERAREYLSIVIRYDEKNARILEKLN